MSTGSRVRRAMKVIVPAAITLVVIALVVREVEVARLLDAFASADLVLVVVACALALFFNTVQSAELLRAALSAFGTPVSFRGALAATVGNLAIHAVLPAATGNVSRVAYLVKKEGANVPRSTAAVLALLWMKLVSLFGLAALGWTLAERAEPWQGAVSVAGFVLTLAGGLAVPRLAALLRRLVPKRLERIDRALGEGLDRIAVGRLLYAGLHSFVAVAIELAIFQVLLRAVGGPFAPVAILATFPLVVIGAKVPLTLMGIGTREALVLVSFGAASSGGTLLAATLLFSFAEHVLSALAGTLLTYRFVRALAD
ncbi:MAG: lysylphosphatidylglycerol synthase transmembrane domain-containing protein [Sandaracinaceae bacterium]